MEKDERPEIPSVEYKISESDCILSYENWHHLGYAPDNEYYSKLMENVVKRFDMILVGFDNETELNKWAQNQTRPVVGVYFEEVKRSNFYEIKKF
jgi:hypothetical protein